MELHIKITMGLLLLVQAVHLASLQYTTDSLGRTIDRSYLRGLSTNNAGSQSTAGEESQYDQRAAEDASESSNEYGSGIGSDSLPVHPEQQQNVTDQDKDAKAVPDDLITVPPSVAPAVPYVSARQPESPDATMPPAIVNMDAANTSRTNTTDAEENLINATENMDPANTSRTNTTDVEENSNNSVTTLQTAQNSTGSSEKSNDTVIHTSVLGPKSNATRKPTETPDKDVWLSNITGSNKTATTSSPTVLLLETTTPVLPVNTPEKANTSDQSSAEGSGSERGLESDSSGRRSNRAWGGVLGTAAAVACVGTVIYFLLKKQHKKVFSHRKLVEECHSDPVLRLDNGEPLDFSLGEGAYYNPGLQADNIQMTSLPGRH